MIRYNSSPCSRVRRHLSIVIFRQSQLTLSQLLTEGVAMTSLGSANVIGHATTRIVAAGSVDLPLSMVVPSIPTIRTVHH